MRSYRQFCALARAIDVLGERWTLLLVRELMLGPRRFSDLLAGLPGIAPNLLADRLRALEARGVVERATLEPPAASRVYRLTDRGRSLKPALLALTRWGMEPMAAPREDEERQAGWYALALEAAFRPERARGVSEDYELVVDGTSFHLRVRDGRCEASAGHAPAPAFVLRCTLDDLLATVTGAGDPAEGQLDGSRGAFNRFRRAFPLPAPVSA